MLHKCKLYLPLKPFFTLNNLKFQDAETELQMLTSIKFSNILIHCSIKCEEISTIARSVICREILRYDFVYLQIYVVVELFHLQICNQGIPCNWQIPRSCRKLDNFAEVFTYNYCYLQKISYERLQSAENSHVKLESRRMFELLVTFETGNWFQNLRVSLHVTRMSSLTFKYLKSKYKSST